MTVALLSGGFALTGGLGGVLLSSALSRGSDARRFKAEDERRWLSDRRAAYADFLGLAESMLRQMDGIGVFLSYDGTKAISRDDEQLLADGLLDYFIRWDEALQPALGQVELLASPKVADLADRVSAALMEATAPVELRRAFTEYHPVWFQAQDLVEVLRNAMRAELGLDAMSVDERKEGRRSGDWPWLPDRPPRESYLQRH